MLLKVLQEREALQSTGIGEGVAIPHGKLPGLHRLIASFARSRAGVDFESIDGQPTHLFFLLVVPEHSGGQHLKALARISRFFRDAAFRTRLDEAETLDDVLSRHRGGRRQVLGGRGVEHRSTASLVRGAGRGDRCCSARAGSARASAPSSWWRGVIGSWRTTSCGCGARGRLGLGWTPEAHPTLPGDPWPRGCSTSPICTGRDAVADEGPVDVVVRLERWREGAEYERVGLERPQDEFCGVSLPSLVLPVRPAASMATLVEVVARDHRSRRRGEPAVLRVSGARTGTWGRNERGRVAS